MSLSVDTVVVPVTFEPDKPNELNMERAIQVRSDHWVIVSEATVAALDLACKLAGETGIVHLTHATLDLSPTAAVHGPAAPRAASGFAQVRGRRGTRPSLGHLPACGVSWEDPERPPSRSCTSQRASHMV